MAERGNVVRHLTVLTAGMVLLTSVLGARAGFAQSATGTPAAAEADAEG
ncbi:MAG: hypothetical protein QOF01_584, partial [Thermomicrobiales bacterium]|nr:hypothetical protein [Thermomicrobiales bacterium]